MTTLNMILIGILIFVIAMLIREIRRDDRLIAIYRDELERLHREGRYQHSEALFLNKKLEKA